MSRKTRKILIAALAVVFAASLGLLGWRLWDYSQGDKAYSQAEELIQLPDLSGVALPTRVPVTTPGPAASPSDDFPQQSGEPSEDDPPEESEEPVVWVDPYADLLAAMDFTALREINGDVLGWILMPGTVISYPLLQGDDNDYYLNHTWNGGWSSVGAIFMEYRCSADLSGFNTIIYGHRMMNGTMFAYLKYYNSWSYWASAPYVYITDDTGSYRYDIFAAYEAAVDSPTYQIHFSSDASKQAFLDSCLERSVIDTGVVPQVDDLILTLSTCTGDGYDSRWVVQAVRWMEPTEPEDPTEGGEPGDSGDPAASEDPAESGDPAASNEPAASGEPPATAQPSATIAPTGGGTAGGG